MGKHPGTSRGADYMRGFTWGVKGEEVVMSNLNKQLEALRVKSMKGLIMAAAFIRIETEKTEPLTPVDKGNLRASWFVTTAKRVEVGYGSPRFKGKKAAQMASDHVSVINEAHGTVAAESSRSRQFLMMGYSANYGGYVHEMIGANFSRTGSGPKWLETHIKKNTGKIVQIVKDNSQIR